MPSLTAARILRTAFTSLLLVFLAATAHAEHHEGAEGQQVVVHLSHYTDDLHAASMALKVSEMLASAGAKVTMFIDLEGVRLADTRTPQDLRWGQTVPISELYARAVEAGVTIFVCPHCAEAAGMRPTDLREGAAIASPDTLASMFLSADKVIDF